jgi:uncharacterized protein with HEPN domain
MRSDKTIITLQEMVRHIDLAMQFLEGANLIDFQHDVRNIYAVTRCLEIISEASRRLPEDLKARHPSTQWRQIAAAGNVYRHEYESVAPRIIMDTVQTALPALRAVILGELESQAAPIPKA